MEHSFLKYFTYNWAVAGISETGSCLPVSFLQKTGKSLEESIEIYLKNYLKYWRIIADLDVSVQVSDESVYEEASQRIEQYIALQLRKKRQIEHLPKFYIIFLNQPQIGCDTNGFSDVFCF